jgi:hypothetical protein
MRGIWFVVKVARARRTRRSVAKDDDDLQRRVKGYPPETVTALKLIVVVADLSQSKSGAYDSQVLFSPHRLRQIGAAEKGKVQKSSSLLI